VTHDIVVCGAGPAGSTVAQRLAAAGARVALIGTVSRPGCEGLSVRSRALLAEEGVLDQAAAIDGPLARRGVWAGRAIEGTEWLVERSQLADALRARACIAGADDRRDTVMYARRVSDHWRVRLRGGAVLTAPMLVDARGRRGAEHRGPLLLAFGQRFWRRTAGASGTGIGVTDAGWCWWAERGHGLWVQVVGRPRAGHPAAWAASAAAQIPALARALDGTTAEGNPVARPAPARLGAAGSEPTLWRVGDAAFALDPLSGQGVYEALRGARLVATAIQSVIDGDDAQLAQRFIGLRREQAWQRGVRAAAGFYRENGDRGVFWAEAAAAYAALLPAQPAPPPDRTAAARIERRPVLDRGRICERDVVITAENPRGVWHVAGVPLAPLKDYLDTAEYATIAGASVVLDRPQAAVASAIHWLQEAGAVLRQDPPRVSLGG
jgi:2-polyprenyl-6-methoxyphenol hydroxylase-like FAD-dependent oxidoreductase